MNSSSFGRRIHLIAAAVLSLALPLTWLHAPVFADQRSEEIIANATQLLNETMTKPLSRVPQSMIENACGVAIIPNVIKGSFIVGARHGKGVLFVKEPNGVWHAPVFVSLTGGNIGWQVGVQSSDIILVFRTQRCIQGILNGKLTLGADVAAAAGPIGREGAIGTDGKLQAEVFTYSRSRGLFAGVSIDGSVLQVDRLSTGSYYQITATNQTPTIPAPAQQLTEMVARYAASIAAGAASGTSALQVGASESEVVRGQLVQIAPKLFDLLDDSWKEYLGLPAVMFLGGAPPDPATINEIVGRYDSVARDPQFATLAARPEFQSVYGLLKHYQSSLAPTAPTMQLPPPPANQQPILAR